MPAVSRCFLLCLVALGAIGPLGAAGDYSISLKSAASGTLHVTLDTACRGSSVELQMAVWDATYYVRDFSRFVSGFMATDGAGSRLATTKPNPSRWIVECADADRIRVDYDVLANRPGPFGAFADSRYATLNLAQVLLYAVDGRSEEHLLRFTDLAPKQKLAITLEEEAGLYRAPSFDLLTDTPVLIGDFVEASFQFEDSTIRVVAFGDSGGFDLDVLLGSVSQIVKGTADVMEGLPLSRYTFIYCFQDIPGGGMEYRDGTIIFGPAECSKCRLSSLSAHEFFHLWNVKRIRPASLEPVDYTRAMPTPSLWFVEGVTSSFAEFIRLKIGAGNPSEFLAHLGNQISLYMDRPARLEQSAEQGSVEAWLEGYAEYGSPKRSVSYYLRGELIGYLLDLSIRHHTKNRKSLDDVFRLLNKRHGHKGRPYDDTDAIEQAVSEVAATDLTGLIETLVKRPDPIAWNTYLRYAGYRLSTRKKDKVDLGLALSNAPGRGIVVSEVDPGGAAHQAGFRLGDRIVRYQTRRIASGPQGLAAALRRAVGRRVSIGVERQGTMLDIEITPQTSEQVAYRITPLAQPTRLQLRVRNGWLTRITEQ